MATEVAAQGDLMQDLIDGICFSIPFYLGNRTRPAHLHDFTDREIRFPSLHSVGTERAKIALRRQAGDDTAMFEDEHRRHVTVNGAWHAMSILSTLLTIISEQAVANRLQPEQKSWICEQLDRRLPQRLKVACLRQCRMVGRGLPRRLWLSRSRKNNGAKYLACPRLDISLTRVFSNQHQH
ncbi:hypothetical protein KC329_g18 [Hortaea werneckii]|nr:hypothetical protein KC329_g18 [Hortaea werneckii]